MSEMFGLRSSGSRLSTYHRALTLTFEEALLTVDPKIEALPYWDYNVEASSVNPRSSEIWEWFGRTEGDESEGNAIKDGRFSHWRVRANASDISAYTNPYGYLRAPWNGNPSPRITRFRYSCGGSTDWNSKMWDVCFKEKTYIGWYACIDPTVHTWAHSYLGGVWGTDYSVGRAPCFIRNAVEVPTAWKIGCLTCSSGTDANVLRQKSLCRKTRKLKCFADPIDTAPIYGDFADAWTSPNDPIFFFHHANVDRHLMTWQQRHVSKAPTYGFPKASIPCEGHGLHDLSSPDFPFDPTLLGFPASKVGLSNADIIAVDGLSNTSIYTYDSLLDQREESAQMSLPMYSILSLGLGILICSVVPSMQRSRQHALRQKEILAMPSNLRVHV